MLDKDRAIIIRKSYIAEIKDRFDLVNALAFKMLIRAEEDVREIDAEKLEEV